MSYSGAVTNSVHGWNYWGTSQQIPA